MIDVQLSSLQTFRRLWLPLGAGRLLTCQKGGSQGPGNKTQNGPNLQSVSSCQSPGSVPGSATGSGGILWTHDRPWARWTTWEGVGPLLGGLRGSWSVQGVQTRPKVISLLLGYSGARDVGGSLLGCCGHYSIRVLGWGVGPQC